MQEHQSPYNKVLIPVVTLSEVWASVQLLAWIVSPNPARGMGVCLL
jgi:hypothetical protein